jgi:SAM-dependent methyltransferase
MVAEATRRSEGLSVEFAVADVHDLPLADGALAGYRSERLYQHLGDPGAALAEARRVLAPNGRLVLVDQDWGGLLIDGEPAELTRSLLDAHSDSMRNGWVGRGYRRLLTDAGFADVVVHPETVAITTPELGAVLPSLAVEAALAAGVVDPTAAARWLDDQHARLRAGRFFAAMTYFVGAARRP